MNFCVHILAITGIVSLVSKFCSDDNIYNFSVNLTDSLDSTLDKDNKPPRARLNEDMRPIAESTAEQQTITTTRHYQHQDSDSHESVSDEERDGNEYDGYDFVDGKGGQHNMSDMGNVTQNDDGSSYNKVTDTTTKGILGGKTASGV